METKLKVLEDFVCNGHVITNMYTQQFKDYSHIFYKTSAQKNFIKFQGKPP